MGPRVHELWTPAQFRPPYHMPITPVVPIVPLVPIVPIVVWRSYFAIVVPAACRPSAALCGAACGGSGEHSGHGPKNKGPKAHGPMGTG